MASSSGAIAATPTRSIVGFVHERGVKGAGLAAYCRPVARRRPARASWSNWWSIGFHPVGHFEPPRHAGRSAGMTARSRYSPLAYWKKSSPGLVERSIALEVEAGRRVVRTSLAALARCRASHHGRADQQSNARLHHDLPPTRSANCAHASVPRRTSQSSIRPIGERVFGLPLPARRGYKRALPRMGARLLGRGQVVRHRFLVPAFAGSNPAAPASTRYFPQAVPHSLAVNRRPS